MLQAFTLSNTFISKKNIDISSLYYYKNIQKDIKKNEINKYK